MASNFDFLKSRFPNIADIGKEAERILYNFPDATVMQLGKLAECITDELLFTEKVVLDEDKDNQFGRIEAIKERNILPDLAVSQLHHIRMVRNQVDHGKGSTTLAEASELLQSAYAVALSFYQYYFPDFQGKSFRMPKKPVQKKKEAPKAEQPIETLKERKYKDLAFQKRGNLIALIGALLVLSVILNIVLLFIVLILILHI